MGSRVELFAAIRRDERVEGLSIRELARRHGVHRRTVRAALVDAGPPPRKASVRAAPRLDPYKAAVDEMLKAALSAPRKQRHTARRVHARLVEEHGAVGLSYSTVRDWVRLRRAVIEVEAGRRVEVFVPQEHAPGMEAEVDFGEVWVVLAGIKTKCHMFVFRMSHSGKAIHRIYPTQGQEAFLEGHLAAFDAIGGARPGISVTTTSPPPSPKSCTKVRTGEVGCAVGKRTNAGCCSGRTTVSMRSTVSPGSPARMRRAASRARSAGSDGTGSPRCPSSTRWTS